MTERLWAPWRAAYVTGAEDRPAGRAGAPRRTAPRTAPPCIFCELPAQRRDRANLILRRARRTFVMLNKYPYNNGHLLIAPYDHVSRIEDLPRAVRHEISDEVSDAARRVREAMKPDGMNIGLNIGRAAGAGFADHVHYHIVPRWDGDTNFMAAVPEVRVISQGLEATWKLLDRAFRKGRREKREKRNRRG